MSDICGHRDKIAYFKNVLERGELGHAYLFFGEPHIGKFTFAKALTAQWDKNFLETMIIEPDRDSIGIDGVRSAKKFLSQKPVYAPRRTVILNEMEKLTDEAQNALLKITEEPPVSSLILGIATSDENIFPTLASRFRKVHFGRPADNEIAEYLAEKLGMEKEKARSAARQSLGRPGYLLERQKGQGAAKLAEEFIAKRSLRSTIIEKIIDPEQPTRLASFFEELILILRRNVIANWRALKFVNERKELMARYQTNKKLQLQAIGQFIDEHGR